jgi:hypothetical protein
MAGDAFEGTIETVRGSLAGERRDELLRFWADEAGFEGPAAEERLGEVVCLAIDPSGRIAGVNSAYPDAVPLVGGRRFWVYRSLLSERAAGAGPGMTNAAFDALEAESDQAGDGPLGIVLLDPSVGEDSLLAVWPQTRMLFAGYDGAGTPTRIRYFDDAAVGPAAPGALTTEQMRGLVITLEDNYRVVELGESDEFTNDDVIAFWEREGAVAGEEAQRRVNEVQLVGIERETGIAAVSTAYVQRSPQLRMDVWYYRGFVGKAHRQKSIASYFAVQGVGHMEQRFIDGRDTRGAGVIFEIENEFLKTFLNKGQWLPSDFTFIGENERGDHVRVHYFQGAEAP